MFDLTIRWRTAICKQLTVTVTFNALMRLIIVQPSEQQRRVDVGGRVGVDDRGGVSVGQFRNVVLTICYAQCLVSGA